MQEEGGKDEAGDEIRITLCTSIIKKNSREPNEETSRTDNHLYFGGWGAHTPSLAPGARPAGCICETVPKLCPLSVVEPSMVAEEVTKLGLAVLTSGWLAECDSELACSGSCASRRTTSGMGPSYGEEDDGMGTPVTVRSVSSRTCCVR